jgi:hypothetical protein
MRELAELGLDLLDLLSGERVPAPAPDPEVETAGDSPESPLAHVRALGELGDGGLSGGHMALRSAAVKQRL